jgi:hypothetical protein
MSVLTQCCAVIHLLVAYNGECFNTRTIHYILRREEKEKYK